MNIEIASIILVVAVVGFFGVKTYLSLKDKSKEVIIKEIKIQAYKLFLYAQKKGWAGPDKMTWCVDQVTKLFPEKVKAYIEGPIEKWMQDQYDEFVEYIAENAEKLGIEAK